MASSKSFFELYYEITKRSEPPPNFHAWTGVAVISALLGKKCFIPQGHFTVFPNLYIILVGDPGSRKTTAMNIGKDLVKVIEEIAVAPESASRESLIDTMSESQVKCEVYGRPADYWQVSAFVGELEQFFGGKHINQQMIGFLTAIWDEPIFTERTRKSGKVVIKNPYFSMLGCCTSSWMNSKLQSDVISDGFTRRTIFVLENKENTLNPWPIASPEDEENLKLLRAEVIRIHKLSGQFNFTPEALKLWMELYASFREEAKNHSEKVQHYFSSKHILVQKVSMCLSAAFRNDRVVDTVILKLACRFLEITERSLDTVFSGVGLNPYKKSQDYVLNHLNEHGSTDLYMLNRMMSSDLQTTELREVINSLTESRLITPLSTSPTDFRYQVVTKRKRPEAVNLLQLACHAKVSKETISEETRISSQGHRPVPITELLKVRQEQKKLDSDKGILLRGRSKES